MITFTSDFGLQDCYVGAVKGVIYGINPETQVVDISHDIPPHDISAAALVLAGSCPHFPPETVHLAVVDPGVGSSRKGILAVTKRYRYVAPDNGILSLALQGEEVCALFSLEAERYFRSPISPTFHGRDIFGPVAAWLSRGVEPHHFGPRLQSWSRLENLTSDRTSEGFLEGRVLHIDRFGNIVTSFSAEALREIGVVERLVYFALKEERIACQVEFYAQGPIDQPFFLLGSSGYYEIAARERSAAQLLAVSPGTPLRLYFESTKP
jgi:S-adenosylmethionine hydrolase